MRKAQILKSKFQLIVIIDVVGYTKAVALSEKEARRISAFLKSVATRAKILGFYKISQPGDACVLLGNPNDPNHLLNLAYELFVTDPTEHPIRIVAHHGAIKLELERGKVVNYLGKDVIETYRLEKKADAWQLLLTDTLYRAIEEDISPDIRKIGPRSHKLKGLEVIAPETAVWILEFPRDKSPVKLPKAYVDQRKTLWEQVQVIPVFGGLYDDVPMEDNFLNLTLDRVDGGSVGDRPRRNFVLRDLNEDKQASQSHNINAKDIIQYHPKGMILGLPGAGKTTMLNHIAFSLLKQNWEFAIILVRCRSLTKDNAEYCGITANTRDPEKAIRFLVGSFLFPGEDMTKLAVRKRKVWENTTEQFTKAWKQSIAIIMIDALDEAPDEDLRQRILNQFETLSRNVPDEPISKCNRLYLTSRPAAVHDLKIDHLPRFWVNALHLGHLQQMARFFLGANDPVTKKFNENIAKAPYAAKVGGTPLTALLILTWYRVHGYFEMRYATYDLIVKFVLLRTWDLVKSEEKLDEYGGVAKYFETVKDAHFSDKHTDVTSLYQAFADLAFAALYDHKDNSRTFSEQTFLACMERRVRDQHHAKNLANQWFKDLLDNHLIVKAGVKRYQFIHQTVMEFLAARVLLTNKGLRSQAVRDDMDDLDTWSITCSRDIESAYEMLDYLSHADWPEDSDIPLRCLAETEAMERFEVANLDFGFLIRGKEAEFQRDGMPLRVWEPSSGRELASIPLVAAPLGLAFRPGTMLVTLANHDGSLTELDLSRLGL